MSLPYVRALIALDLGDGASLIIALGPEVTIRRSKNVALADEELTITGPLEEYVECSLEKYLEARRAAQR